MQSKDLLAVPKHLGKELILIVAPSLLLLTAHPDSFKDTFSKPLDGLAGITHISLDADAS